MHSGESYLQEDLALAISVMRPHLQEASTRMYPQDFVEWQS